MSISSVYEKCINGVVSISSGFGSSLATSSGFLIDSQHVVTCCHCICSPSGRKNGTIKVYIDVKGGTIVDGEIIGVDGTLDIAVLRLKKPIPGSTPLKWTLTKPRRGEQCVVIGSPYGDVQSVSSAYVRDTSFYGSGLLPTVFESILIDGSAIGGNSGGPMINMKGEVVGVISYGYTGVVGGTMNAAVPAWIASPVVADIIRNKRNYSFGTLGVKVSPMFIDDAIFLGIDKIQGYMIIDTTSTALSLGIRDGDIITHMIIKGTRYELGQLNSQHCIFSLIHLNPRASVQLIIRRDSDELSIPLTIPSTTSTVPQNGNL